MIVSFAAGIIARGAGRQTSIDDLKLASLDSRAMRMAVLVTQAGGCAATNLVTSLRRGIPDVTVIGSHDDPFVLKKSNADVNYLLPTVNSPNYAESMSYVVRAERVSVVVPVSDADVAAVSRMRRRLRASVFLPRHPTLALCYDKLRVAVTLRRYGVPAPKSYPVSGLRDLDRIFDRLGSRTGGWCRARRGAGSFAAAPVASPRDARAWISLWTARRGAAPSAFMISEYLPGRDFACQSLWRAGKLILIKTTERLAYVDGAARLSGTSSIAALHKTVSERRLVDVATAAVHAVDRLATGAFSIDLKENEDGVPCVTEINGGRLLSGTTIFDQAGEHNMSVAYVRLAKGDRLGIRGVYDSPEGVYVSRELDTPPHVFDAKEFWLGWHDARSVRRQHTRTRRRQRHGRTASNDPR